MFQSSLCSQSIICIKENQNFKINIIKKKIVHINKQSKILYKLLNVGNATLDIIIYYYCIIIYIFILTWWDENLN